MRLQKYLSHAGVCSRRRAEELILAGRVTINGQTAHLGDQTDETTDVVCVDGKPVLAAAESTYILLHKPRGFVSTLRDPEGRPTVAELVSDAGVRLYPVGRLDLMSEGLLLMTDDGDAANRLAHPSHGVEKTYRVWVRGEELPARIEKLRAPIVYRGVAYRGARVEILDMAIHRAKLDMTLSEGKNREIRNMCASVGLTVERLLRWRQGEIVLGDLPAGKWRYLTATERLYLQNSGDRPQK